MNRILPLARAAMAAQKPDPSEGDFATDQYKIAPLDVLSAVVWDHPELTSPWPASTGWWGRLHLA